MIRVPRTVHALAIFTGLLLGGRASAQDQRPIQAPPDVGAPARDAKRTKTGLATLVLQRGSGGSHPLNTDTVIVEILGWTSDGRMFDTGASPGRPMRLFLGGTLPGLSEALQLMEAGEKRRVWVPESLAFPRPTQGRPSGALVLDVELIDIPSLASRQTPDLRTDRRAQKTASGLEYLILRTGASARHPADEGRVTFEAGGWKADGKLFVLSTSRSEPITMSVRQLAEVFPGVAEGLKLMVEGGKARLWIPEGLGYKPSPPDTGPLVLDLLLLAVDPGEPPAGTSRSGSSSPATGAPSSLPAGVERPGGAVTWPTVVHEQKPQYTSDAMRAKIQGTVVLEAIVEMDGTTADIRIIKSLDPFCGLDDEAVKAARQWRFRPSTRGGEPVRTIVRLELQFTLR